MPVLNYCDIQGGWAGAGGNNIDQDPLFTDPGHWNSEWVEGDYHLLPGSPCIDSGFGDSGATVPMTDLDGDPRCDDPEVANTGGGTPDYVDIGAYELKGPLADILWRNGTTGEVSIWLMNGMAIASSGSSGFVPTAWKIKGCLLYTSDLSLIHI